MTKSEIEKLESYGYVADSKKVRESLILELDNNQKSLEQIQEELKKIKKNAKKQGLFTREELNNKKWSIEEAIDIAEKKKINYAYTVLLKKLPNKQKEKIKKI